MDENERKTNDPRSKDAREQISIDCLDSVTHTRTNSKSHTAIGIRFSMDARTIEDLEAVDSSVGSTELIQRWKEIVKPGNYRMTGENGRYTMNPSFNETEGE